jgi:hypothetical protein
MLYSVPIQNVAWFYQRAMKVCEVMEGGGRAQRRHRFRPHRICSLSEAGPDARKRRGGYRLPAVLHDTLQLAALAGGFYGYSFS